ncbi:MAG: hypothetical protein ACRC10_01790 [Thermoguttaceae bacterium]
MSLCHNGACYAESNRLVSTEDSAQQIVVDADSIKDPQKNLVPRDPLWSDLTVLNGPSGFVQWNFAIPNSAVSNIPIPNIPIPNSAVPNNAVPSRQQYYLHFRFASGENRPVTLILDGQTVERSKKLLERNTGGFFAQHLDWETVGPFELESGEHSVRLRTRNCLPHVLGFVLSTSSDLPDDSVFEQARLAHEERQRSQFREQMSQTRTLFQQQFPEIKDIVFIKRPTFQSSHYYTDFIDGAVYFGSSLCRLNIADGTVVEIVKMPGIIGRSQLSFDANRIIFDHKEKIGEGFRIWEVNIDGTGLRQLTFPPNDEPERIARYRQPQHGRYMHHTDDFHPCYLPDGGICFVSTRCEYGILCDGPDILTTSVLYRADANGQNLEKLSNNSVSESTPSVMNDGRILYTRWEYIDNGSVSNKGLWAVRPDGTRSEEVYGANIAFPPVFHCGQAVPGSNDYVICLGAPHMPVGLGTVLRIDLKGDRRTGEATTYITPEVDVRHQWGWDNVPNGATKPFQPDGLIQTTNEYDGAGNTNRGPLFMDPFPLSSSIVLVSHNPDQVWNTPNAYAVYLIDDQGNRNLLHFEPNTSCWCPQPILSRHVPNIAKSAVDPKLAEEGLAHVVVTDVYRGLDGVEPGTVKYIRINEQVPRPWSARRHWAVENTTQADCVDQQHSVVSLNTHLGLKRQIGIVPVQEDGSASFLIPADKNIFFQVLDENFREIQRERTFVNYRPGEVRACVGCHERVMETSQSPTHFPIALQKEPIMPGPQPGEISGARPLYYAVDVQPVLDKYCISCHNADVSSEKNGNLILTGEMTTHFNRSYEELMRRKLFPLIGENHPKAGNNHYIPPYTLGSAKNQLIERLEDPNSPCHLNAPIEDWIRLTTWIDSNGQYYGTYYGKKNLQYRGDPDFRPVPKYEDLDSLIPPTGFWPIQPK